MTTFERLSSDCPRTMNALSRWITSRDAELPFNAYLRGRFLDMPVEVRWGVIVAFFAERHFILTTSTPTMNGKVALLVFKKTLSGRYKMVYQGRSLKPMGASFFETAIDQAVRLHERIAWKVAQVMSPDDNSIVAGMDYHSMARR